MISVLYVKFEVIKKQMKKNGPLIIVMMCVAVATVVTSCIKSGNNPVAKKVTDTCTNVYLVKANDTMLVCLPTAFTPNGDGKNDIYQPIGAYLDSFRNFQMSIYASDTLIYQSNCIDSGWDGTDRNKKRCTGYRYDVHINIKYPNGKISSNCSYVFLVPTNPINGCIQAVNTDTLLYRFADQYNDTTGMIVYPTAEFFCP